MCSNILTLLLLCSAGQKRVKTRVVAQSIHIVRKSGVYHQQVQGQEQQQQEQPYGYQQVCAHARRLHISRLHLPWRLSSSLCRLLFPLSSCTVWIALCGRLYCADDHTARPVYTVGKAAVSC